jgi:pyrroloquinoline-quinone synthase
VSQKTAWSADDFIRALNDVGATQYHDRHPFQERMMVGRLDKTQVRGWITNRFYYQRNIPIKDALIVAKLPDQDARRQWETRITDHRGTAGVEGGIAAWIRFGEACGISEKALLSEEFVLPATRAAVDSYVEFCRERTWIEGVAASLTELFAPNLMANRMRALQNHYPWIRPDGLDYFRRRLELAPHDADKALTLVVQNARTRTTQEAAVAALRFKCDVLWALLDAVESGYPNQGQW